MKVNSLPREPLLLRTPQYCAERGYFVGDVFVQVDPDTPCVDPILIWRSVSVEERQKLGLLTPPPAQFLHASMEHAQQVDELLRSIDEKYSKDAATQAWIDSITQQTTQQTTE